MLVERRSSDVDADGVAGALGRRLVLPMKEGMPLYPAVALHKHTGLQRKRDRRVRWKHVPIQSSAVDGPLDVRHWVKKTTVDYRFAKFNKKIKIVGYSDEEYVTLIAPSDADASAAAAMAPGGIEGVDRKWTRAETDQLMDLCERFDLRFRVIQDRFDGPEPRPTLEQLKKRYYTVSEAVVKHRYPDTFEQHAIFQERYDFEHEAERRKQLSLLFERTREQEVELARLALEARQYDQQIARLSKEQKETKKLLRAQQQVLALSRSIAGVQLRKKKKQSDESATGDDADSTIGPLGPTLAGLPEEVIARNPFKSRPSGFFLRSTQLLTPLAVHPRIAKQCELEIAHMGIKLEDFTVPSAVVSEMFDCLRQDLITLINLQIHTKAQEQVASELQGELESNRSRRPVKKMKDTQRKPQQRTSIPKQKRPKKKEGSLESKARALMQAKAAVADRIGGPGKSSPSAPATSPLKRSTASSNDSGGRKKSKSSDITAAQI